MKRQMTFAALLAAAVLAFPTGCQKGIEEPGNGTSGKRFPGYDGLVVSIERGPRDTKNALGSLGSEVFTKTCLDAQDYVCWSDGDKVDVNGTELTVLAPAFGEPSQDAMVSGGEPVPNTSGRKYCGYFPASGYWNTSDKTIELPETRTYNPASPMEGVPMYAESDDKYLEFRSPFGLMEFNFTGDKTLTSLELTCDSGDLSGTFVIDASGNAVLKPGTTGTKKVTISFGSGLSVSGGKKVYVALAPGTYSGLALTIKTEEYTTSSWSYNTWGGLYYKSVFGTLAVLKGNVYTNIFNTGTWEGVLMWYPAPGEPGLYWSRYNLNAAHGYKESEYGAYIYYGVTTPFVPSSYGTNGFAGAFPGNSNGFAYTNCVLNGNASSYNYTTFSSNLNARTENEVLKPEYDPAHVILGGTWRMTTSDDFKKLKQACCGNQTETLESNFAWSSAAIYADAPAVMVQAVNTSTSIKGTRLRLWFPAAGMGLGVNWSHGDKCLILLSDKPSATSSGCNNAVFYAVTSSLKFKYTSWSSVHLSAMPVRPVHTL